MTKILNTLRVTGTGSGQAFGVTGGYVSVNDSINIGGSLLPSSRLDINGTSSTTYINLLVNNSSVLNAGTVSLNLLGNYSLLFGTQSVSGTWSIYQYSTASNYFAGKIYQNSLYNSGDNLQVNGSGYINRLLISGDAGLNGDDSALKIKYVNRLCIDLTYSGTMSAGDNITLTVRGGSTVTTLYSYTASGTESLNTGLNNALRKLITNQFPNYLWYVDGSTIFAPQGAASGFWTASVSMSAPLASYSITPSNGSFVDKTSGASNANIPSLNLGVSSIGYPFILFQSGSTRDTSNTGDAIISKSTLSRFQTFETSGNVLYFWGAGNTTTNPIQSTLMGAKIAKSGVLTGQTLYITSYENAGAGLTASSGSASMVKIGNPAGNSTFIATSGNASLTQLTLEPTISQRLTANGITRGLWINGVFSTAETRATSTYSIATLGAIGATISLFANSIQLNSPYSIVGSSASQAASGIASSINSYSLTNGGYSATSSGVSIVVTAPTGSGSGANSYITSYQGVGTTITLTSFIGGVDGGSASDWRSFDDPSNAGHTVYQSGKLSKNYFAGRTIFGATFGSSSDDTTSLLQVIGTASINNLILSNSISSGGYSVLVRNSSSGKIETFTASLTASMIGGTGSTNYLSYFNSSSTIAQSSIYQGSTNKTIVMGYVSPSTYDTDTNVLRVKGDVYFDNISNKFNIGGVQLFDNTNSNIALGNGANNGGTAGSNNVALGYSSLMSNQTGIYNVGVGFNTLQTLTAGSYNMAVGANALYNNKGNRNTSIGYQSGYTSTGDGNTFIGNLSGTGMTSGNYNTFIGASSSWTSSVPSNYVVITDGIGTKKLVIDNTNAVKLYGPLIDIVGSTGLSGQVLSATSGGFVWINSISGVVNGSGSASYIPLWSSSTGLSSSNIYQGLSGSIIIGYSNPSIYNSDDSKIRIGGNFTIDSFTSKILINGTQLFDDSRNNISLGASAGGNGLYGGTGSYNISIGRDSLKSSTASRNVAIGYQSLGSSTYTSVSAYGSPDDNIAIGYRAANTVKGSGNLAIGTDAMYNANGVVIGNHGLGFYTLKNLSSGQYNHAYGDQSMLNLTTGSNNVGLGRFTLYGTGVNPNFSNNTGVGHQSLQQMSTGQGNIGLGYISGGSITSGSSNIVISNIATSISTGSYNVAIGNYDAPNSSNTIYLSDGAGNLRLMVDSSGQTNMYGTASWGSGNSSIQIDNKSIVMQFAGATGSGITTITTGYSYINEYSYPGSSVLIATISVAPNCNSFYEITVYADYYTGGSDNGYAYTKIAASMARPYLAPSPNIVGFATQSIYQLRYDGGGFNGGSAYLVPGTNSFTINHIVASGSVSSFRFRYELKTTVQNPFV